MLASNNSIPFPASKNKLNEQDLPSTLQMSAGGSSIYLTIRNGPPTIENAERGEQHQDNRG
jgi:hypothetical protein